MLPGVPLGRGALEGYAMPRLDGRAALAVGAEQPRHG